jgi:hypothetical protein
MPPALSVRKHIPGARFALRSQLATVLQQSADAQRYVLTCGSAAWIGNTAWWRNWRWMAVMDFL